MQGCSKDFDFTLTDGLFLFICVHLPYIFALLPGSLSSLVLHANSVRLKIITEDLTDEQQKIVNENLTQQLQVYVMHNNVSTAEGVCALIEYIIKVYNVTLESVGMGCLEIIVQCPTLESLESLWRECSSGLLDKIAESYLISDEVKRKLNLEHVRVKTCFMKENYLLCKKALMDIAGEFSNVKVFKKLCEVKVHCRDPVSLRRDQEQLNTLICVELYYYSMQISKQTSITRSE